MGVQATHPRGPMTLSRRLVYPLCLLAAQRVAGFALGLATTLFGWGILEGKMLPRWLGAAPLAAGGVGIVLALVFREDTKADQAAFVLPVVWQLVTAVVMLRRA